MANLTISLTSGAQLHIQESSGTSCGGGEDVGSYYSLMIGSARSSADVQNGEKVAEIDSSAAYVALPISAGISGRLLYVRSKSGDALSVRVTHAAQGATVYPLAAKGMLLIEVPEAEGITLLEVQGEGKFEWSLSGVIP